MQRPLHLSNLFQLCEIFRTHIPGVLVLLESRDVIRARDLMRDIFDRWHTNLFPNIDVTSNRLGIHTDNPLSEYVLRILDGFLFILHRGIDVNVIATPERYEALLTMFRTLLDTGDSFMNFETVPGMEGISDLTTQSGSLSLLALINLVINVGGVFMNWGVDMTAPAAVVLNGIDMCMGVNPVQWLINNMHVIEIAAWPPVDLSDDVIQDLLRRLSGI